MFMGGAGSVVTGCKEGSKLLSQSQLAYSRGCGKHEWIRLSQVQGDYNAHVTVSVHSNYNTPSDEEHKRLL